MLWETRSLSSCYMMAGMSRTPSSSHCLAQCGFQSSSNDCLPYQLQTSRLWNRYEIKYLNEIRECRMIGKAFDGTLGSPNTTTVPGPSAVFGATPGHRIALSWSSVDRATHVLAIYLCAIPFTQSWARTTQLSHSSRQNIWILFLAAIGNSTFCSK